MPLPFYLSCLALAGLCYVAWEVRWKGWGLPMGMVLGTVGVWYVGDVFYNDYDAYRASFGADTLGAAWWQVLWFVGLFGVLAPTCHRLLNQRLPGKRSHVMAYLERQRFRHPEVQRRLDRLASGLFTAWGLLMVVALVQVRGDVIGLFAPYLGQKANPWARGQIGGGFSAVISFASYLQIFLTAACGVVAALARNSRTQTIALTICLLGLPFYIFDRTRSDMLATAMPGILVFILMRLRLRWMGKFAVLGAAFLLVSVWFAVVAETRQGMRFDVDRAMEAFASDDSEGRHVGLNMFEELAWIHYLTETGRYEPNWGDRYFAELVNPIPRGLWREKPTIGLDYAVARGQEAVGPKGEMTATISTGMIGQGVVNFGPIGGPAAAAVLMALWVALLARQDLLGANPGRIVLYGTGMILTFNLGRDITLLVLYPFVFGLVLYHVWMRVQTRSAAAAPNRRGREGKKRCRSERVDRRRRTVSPRRTRSKRQF